MSHKVLVVDDDPQILRTLRINLSAHGYRVVLAPDGAAALRAAADEQPDVIVLDLGLPDMDGTEVIAGVRGWTSVPIIVLTARTGAAENVEALDTGADDYVTKPFGIASCSPGCGPPYGGRPCCPTTVTPSSTRATSSSTSPPRRCAGPTRPRCT